MGADLLLAAVVAPVGRELDWEAAHPAIDTLDEDTTQAIAEECNVALDAIREGLHDAVRYLSGYPGDTTEFLVPGYRVFVAGGMSWGDDPTRSFTELRMLCHAPSVLTAIGFGTGDG
jgi:hypothetical protein